MKVFQKALPKDVARRFDPCELLGISCNATLVFLIVTLRLDRRSAFFLSIYHGINSLQQIQTIVRELSREQHLSSTPLILNPYLFLCFEEPHVLLIKHGRVVPDRSGPVRVHEIFANPRPKRRIA